jgi:hypothetical protein
VYVTDTFPALQVSKAAFCHGSARVPATKQCSTYHVRCPDGTEHGPFSRGELESLAAAGELTADCLLCELNPIPDFFHVVFPPNK